LSAHLYYQRGKHYDVSQDTIEIIDKESSGQKMEGRRWSYGLDTALRIKENLTVEPEQLSIASMTLPEILNPNLGLVSTFSAASGTIDQKTAELFEIPFVSLDDGKANLGRTDQATMFSDKMSARKAAVGLIAQLRSGKLTDLMKQSVSAIGALLVRCESDSEVSEVADDLLKTREVGKGNVVRITQEGKVVGASFTKDLSEMTLADLQEMAKDDSAYDTVIIEFTSANNETIKDMVEELSRFKKVIIVSTNLAGRGVDFKGKDMVAVSLNCDELDETDTQFRGRVARDGKIGFWFGFWSLQDAVFRKYENLVPEELKFFKTMVEKYGEYDLGLQTDSSESQRNREIISQMRKAINDHNQNMRLQEKQFGEFLQPFNVEQARLRQKIMRASIDALIEPDVLNAIQGNIVTAINTLTTENDLETLSINDILGVLENSFGFGDITPDYVVSFLNIKVGDENEKVITRQAAAAAVYAVITDHLRLTALRVVDQEWMRFVSDMGLNKHRLQQLPSRPGYQKNFINPNQIYAEIKRITAELYENSKKRMERNFAENVIGAAYQLAGKAVTPEALDQAAKEASRVRKISLWEKLRALFIKAAPWVITVGANIGLAAFLTVVFNGLTVGGVSSAAGLPVIGTVFSALLAMGPVWVLSIAIATIFVGWALSSQVKRLAQVDSYDAKMADYVALGRRMPLKNMIGDIGVYTWRKTLNVIATFAPFVAATTLISLVGTTLFTATAVGGVFLLATAVIGMIGVGASLALLATSRQDLKRAPRLPMSGGKRFLRGAIGGVLTTVSIGAALVVTGIGSAFMFLVPGVLAIALGGGVAYKIFNASSDAAAKNKFIGFLGFASGLLIGGGVLGFTALYGAFVLKSILISFAGTAIGSGNILAMAGYPLVALFSIQGILMLMSQFYFAKRIAQQDAITRGEATEKKMNALAYVFRSLVLNARTVLVSGGALIGVVFLLKGVWMFALPVVGVSLVMGYLSYSGFKKRMEKQLDYSYLAGKPGQAFERSLNKLPDSQFPGFAGSLRSAVSAFKEQVTGTRNPLQLAYDLMDKGAAEDRILQEFLTQVRAVAPPKDGRFFSRTEIDLMVSKMPAEMLPDEQRPAFTRAVTEALVELNLAKVGFSRFLNDHVNAEKLTKALNVLPMPLMGASALTTAPAAAAFVSQSQYAGVSYTQADINVAQAPKNLLDYYAFISSRTMNALMGSPAQTEGAEKKAAVDWEEQFADLQRRMILQQQDRALA
ncbi:MAG: hypothetical protein PHO30_08040, partial [Candidatus Omnitrophica bacterium]|nr:hypothetical protein [Candidatus Omnitrophota bacterium]